MQFWEPAPKIKHSERRDNRDNRPAWMVNQREDRAGDKVDGVIGNVDHATSDERRGGNEGQGFSLNTANVGDVRKGGDFSAGATRSSHMAINESIKQREQIKPQWREQRHFQLSTQLLENRIRKREAIEMPFLWTPSPPQSPQRRESSHSNYRVHASSDNIDDSCESSFNSEKCRHTEPSRGGKEAHILDRTTINDSRRSRSRSRSRGRSRSLSRSSSESRSRSRRHRRHRKENRSLSRSRSGSRSRSRHHRHHHRRHHHHRSHNAGENNDSDDHETRKLVQRHDNNSQNLFTTLKVDATSINELGSQHEIDEIERYKRDILGLIPDTKEAEKNVSIPSEPLSLSVPHVSYAVTNGTETYDKMEGKEEEEEDEMESIGPALPANFVTPSLTGPTNGSTFGHSKGAAYGSHLLKGEGAAMASFVQQGIRIPRRGEVSWSGDQIEKLESVGFCMSGSRHKRMNEVRLRKENQVFTAEEKRALAIAKIEEKQAHEQKVLREFSDMIKTNEAIAISKEEQDREAALLIQARTKIR